MAMATIAVLEGCDFLLEAPLPLALEVPAPPPVASGVLAPLSFSFEVLAVSPALPSGNKRRKQSYG